MPFQGAIRLQLAKKQLFENVLHQSCTAYACSHVEDELSKHVIGSP